MIQENLERLVLQKAELIIRVPIIPDFNGSEREMTAIANYVKGLGIGKVELMPYHTMGEHKYDAAGLTVQKFSTPTAEDMMKWRAIFADRKLL